MIEKKGLRKKKIKDFQKLMCSSQKSNHKLKRNLCVQNFCGFVVNFNAVKLNVK